MERSNHFEWFENLDDLLKEEEIVLEGLKKAVEEGWMTQDELEENIEAYHHGRTAMESNPDSSC
jgi:hypothetical protein